MEVKSQELTLMLWKRLLCMVSRTYGAYSSYQEALEASQELENKTLSESFFTVERAEKENQPK